MKRSIVLSFVLLMAGLAAGCASGKSSLKSQDIADRVESIKRVGVIVAEARIYNLGAGGSKEFNPDASERCEKCAESAALKSLVDRGYVAVLIPLDDDVRALLSDYAKARGDISTPFQSNQGKIEGVPLLACAPQTCAKNDVDGVVFVGAVDHVSTGGRKALLGAMAVFGITGGQGIAYADLSVVDRTGKLLYYDQKSGTNYSLTDDSNVLKVYGELVAGLPAAGGR